MPQASQAPLSSTGPDVVSAADSVEAEKVEKELKPMDDASRLIKENQELLDSFIEAGRHLDPSSAAQWMITTTFKTP